MTRWRVLWYSINKSRFSTKLKTTIERLHGHNTNDSEKKAKVQESSKDCSRNHTLTPAVRILCSLHNCFSSFLGNSCKSTFSISPNSHDQLNLSSSHAKPVASLLSFLPGFCRASATPASYHPPSLSVSPSPLPLPHHPHAHERQQTQTQETHQ